MPQIILTEGQLHFHVLKLGGICHHCLKVVVVYLMMVEKCLM
jgi:hypothetical protein